MANQTNRMPKRDAKFFEILAKHGVVGLACKAATYSRSQAYQYRKDDPDFAAGWDDALETYTEALEAEADRRARDGTERGVYYKGERIGTVNEYSDSLLQFRLKALNPEKYRERLDTKVSGDVIVRRQVFVGGGDGG